MADMTQIWERLFLGSRDDAEDLFVANPHGITTVISLCEVRVVHRRQGLNYIHIAVDDDSPIEVGQFDAVMDAIAENVRWGTVLLHCAGGTSRAPILMAAWMHLVGYRNVDAALAEIKKLRPIVDSSSVLLDSVKEHL